MEFRRRTSCSALVTYTEDAVRAGHVTWTSYNNMLRIYKRITWNVDGWAAGPSVQLPCQGRHALGRTDVPAQFRHVQQPVDGSDPRPSQQEWPSGWVPDHCRADPRRGQGVGRHRCRPPAWLLVVLQRPIRLRDLHQVWLRPAEGEDGRREQLRELLACQDLPTRWAWCEEVHGGLEEGLGLEQLPDRPSLARRPKQGHLRPGRPEC